MKKTLFLVMVMACFFACRRQDTFIRGRLLEEKQLRLQLTDSMPAEAMARLDFKGKIRATPDTGRTYFTRIPYFGDPIKTHFLLLKTNATEKILAGREVFLLRTEGIGGARYYGSLVLKRLSGELVLQSPVANGYVMTWHQQESTERTIYPAPLQDPVYAVLPELVVVGYTNPSTGGSMSLTDYLNLQAMFGGGVGGGAVGGGYGGTGYGGYAPGAGGGGGSAIGYHPLDPYPAGGSSVNPIELEPEMIYNQPVVDVARLFKCFDAVPSAGATYTITLCADIPVNNNPYFSGVGISGSSAGHSFLIIRKTNGTASVTQSFGFYPLRAPSFFDPFAAVPGGVMDNRSSEINASMAMAITESQFNAVRAFSIAKANQNYLLDGNNCADYALGAFNLARTIPITVSPLKVFHANTDPYNLSSTSIASIIETSPQMIFVKLREMQKAGGLESGAITIDVSHNYRAPVSHGECN